MSAHIEWTAVQAALPDDDTLVLLALNDDDVWTGFRDGDIWRYVDAMPITAERVTHWMPLPATPALAPTAALPARRDAAQDEAALLDDFRTMDDASRDFMRNVGRAMALGFPRRRTPPHVALDQPAPGTPA